VNNYKVGKITLVVFTLLAIFSMISLSFFSDWQVIYHNTVDPHPEVDRAASTVKAIIWGSLFIVLEAGLVYFCLFSKRLKYLWTRSLLPSVMLLVVTYFSLSGSQFYPKFMDVHLYWVAALTLVMATLTVFSFLTMMWVKIKAITA